MCTGTLEVEWGERRGNGVPGPGSYTMPSEFNSLNEGGKGRTRGGARGGVPFGERTPLPGPEPTPGPGSYDVDKITRSEWRGRT